MNKGNKIIYIDDGRTSSLRIKSYYVFEDSWISEYDKVLCDNDGIQYNVLDYYMTRDYVCDRLSSKLDVGYPISNWKWVNRSCLKLDMEIEIGNILYVKY